MAQQVKEKFVRVDFVEIEQKGSGKQIKREIALAKMEEFLIKLSKERKPVKKNLRKIFKKAELNAKYAEQIVPIQKIRDQQVYRNNEIVVI